jgi:hypothetical protein
MRMVTISGACIAQSDVIPTVASLEGVFGGTAFKDTPGGYDPGFSPLVQFCRAKREKVNHSTVSAAPSWHPTGWLTLQSDEFFSSSP